MKHSRAQEPEALEQGHFLGGWIFLTQSSATILLYRNYEIGLGEKCGTSTGGLIGMPWRVVSSHRRGNRMPRQELKTGVWSVCESVFGNLFDSDLDLLPWKVIWKPKLEVWKVVIFRLHVSFRGCNNSSSFSVSKTLNEMDQDPKP